MGTKTIMILDSEAHSRWALKTLLESERYLVVEVDSIERALRDFSEFKIEGFIAECWIGGASTTGVIREVKTRFPNCYVMILTDKDLREEDYEELLDAGMDDFFSKPASSKKILLHLERGLSRQDNSIALCASGESPAVETSRQPERGRENALGLQSEGGGR